MKIMKIEVLTQMYATDRIFLTTDMPSPFPKGISNNTLVMSFESQRSKGLKYVLENFKGIPTILINGNSGNKEVVDNI